MTVLTVGSGQEFTTISAAVAAATTGDTIDIQAGTYTDDFPGLINGLTIEGVGGIAKLVTDGAQPGNGKAYLDVAGNTTLRNLDISGVTVPDANGAAVRYEGGNLDIENSILHDNQNGILGGAVPGGTIKINQSEIYGNGLGGDGHTHNIYIGDIASFTLTNSYVHDANVGHEVKSRAESNDIENNRIYDNGSTASYGIDLPNGGNATIANNTIQKSANAGNPISIAYGEEGMNYGSNAVSITGNTFVSDKSNADVLNDTSNTPFVTSGNTIYDYAAIDASGHVSSSGFTATGTRPTLDTSSPVDQSGGAASSGGSGSTSAADTSSGSGGSGSTGISDTTTGSSSSGSTTSGSTTSGSTTSGSTSSVSTSSGDTSSGATGSDPSTSSGSADDGSASSGSGSDTTGSTTTGSTTTGGTTTDGTTTGGTTSGSGGTATPPAPSHPINPPSFLSATHGAGAVTIKGTADAGSKVVLTDTVGGHAHRVATVTAGSDGRWSVTSTMIDAHQVNSFKAVARLGTSTAKSSGSLILASGGADTLSGTAGKADVFAFFAASGRDVVRGFETTAAHPGVHDVIDLSGTSYHSFQQLQSKISGSSSAVIRLDKADSVTLACVSAQSLQASDFRFS